MADPVLQRLAELSARTAALLEELRYDLRAAGLEARLQALDHLAREHKEVTWDLLEETGEWCRPSE